MLSLGASLPIFVTVMVLINAGSLSPQGDSIVIRDLRMQVATDRRAKLTRRLGQIVKMRRAANNTSLGVSFYEHDKISPFNTRSAAD
jgi:hypothetical protein